MLLAVSLKAVDALCHLAVPTPTSRHSAVSGPTTLVEYLKGSDESLGAQEQSAQGDRNLTLRHEYDDQL